MYLVLGQALVEHLQPADNLTVGSSAAGGSRHTKLSIKADSMTPAYLLKGTLELPIR